MGLVILTTRLATLLVLHTAGAGMASPAVLVTRPMMQPSLEWLSVDNQTLYRLDEGEIRRLQLNASQLSQHVVFITISPCCRDIRWSFHQGTRVQGNQKVLKENVGGEMTTFPVEITDHDSYMLKLSSSRGGVVAVSVRGEASKPVRLRLRVRSKRRLAANWDPSPIDPQATTYCVVASHQKNYSSLCAAQHDSKRRRLIKPRFDSKESEDTSRIRSNPSGPTSENQVESDVDSYNLYENLRSNFKRKKFGRSTKVTDEDPVVACVGDRTHHLIENLDASRNYYVSVFGIARDRQSGSLLATGSVRPRTTTAKRLRENIPYKAEIRNKNVFYFKATISAGGGLWLLVTTCAGAVDVEVLARGKRIYFVKQVEPHAKIFVPAPQFSSSAQETSDEGSVQFDSSSEETRMRYVVKLVPSRMDGSDGVNVEITASTSRWGAKIPELYDEGAVVRELRPRRSCKSIDIAFLPALHYATDVIRYCITSREILNGEVPSCTSNQNPGKTMCENHVQRPPTRVIVQKISGLRPGKKYAIQVTASIKGGVIPYNILFADTTSTCKDD